MGVTMGATVSIAREKLLTINLLCHLFGSQHAAVEPVSDRDRGTPPPQGAPKFARGDPDFAYLPIPSALSF